MKMKKLITVLVIVMMAVLLAPTSASAASRPYKDVTKAKVGKDAYMAICYCKKHWGYIDLVNTNAKFKPNKKMTRREFCTMLGNFYGDDKVPVHMRADVRKGNKVATERYACHKMVEVSRKLGVEGFEWNPSTNHKLTRAFASQYLKVFAKTDPAFAPHQ